MFFTVVKNLQGGPQLSSSCLWFCVKFLLPSCYICISVQNINQGKFGSFGGDFVFKGSRKWSLKFELATGTKIQPWTDFCLFRTRGILRIRPNSSRNSCRTPNTKVGQFRGHCWRVLVVSSGPRKVDL